MAVKKAPPHPSQSLHDHYDRGAAGPANVARSASLKPLEGKARGSIRTERIDVVKYADTTLYDRMWSRGQLSDRQHRAAETLSKRWTTAGLNPRVVARLETQSITQTSDDDEEPDPSVDPDETARDRYRRLMRQVPSRYAIRLDALLLHQHPGTQHLEALQEALTWLADFWKYPDEAT